MKYQNQLAEENGKMETNRRIWSRGMSLRQATTLFLHLVEGSRMASNTKPEFRGTPILLDKIQFAMIFWIEVT
jgi:hypothetical protein